MDPISIASKQSSIRSKTGQYTPCSETVACDSAHYQVSFKFDSWAKDFGLFCAHRSARHIGRLIGFFANAFTCLALLTLNDWIGRKRMIAVNTVLLPSCLLLAYCAPWFLLKMALLGVAFGMEATNLALHLFLMNESTCNPGSARPQFFYEETVFASPFCVAVSRDHFLRPFDLSLHNC